MATRPSGSESDTLKRLEALRPRFERLRAERIRAEGDIERLSAELAEARRLARDEFGTDDETAIAGLIAAAQAENAALVAAFAGEIAAIEARLAALGEAA
jgi:hypothetical protein